MNEEDEKKKTESDNEENIVEKKIRSNEGRKYEKKTGEKKVS